MKVRPRCYCEHCPQRGSCVGPDIRHVCIHAGIPKEFLQTPAIQTDDRLRVGLLCPCLNVGGAEAWQLALARYTDPARIAWQGCVSVNGPESISPGMGAATSALMPVASGRSAARELAARCDVLVMWAIEDMDGLIEGLPSPPKVVSVCHSPWSRPGDCESTRTRGPIGSSASPNWLCRCCRSRAGRRPRSSGTPWTGSGWWSPRSGDDEEALGHPEDARWPGSWGDCHTRKTHWRWSGSRVVARGLVGRRGGGGGRAARPGEAREPGPARGRPAAGTMMMHRCAGRPVALRQLRIDVGRRVARRRPVVSTEVGSPSSSRGSRTRSDQRRRADAGSSGHQGPLRAPTGVRPGRLWRRRVGWRRAACDREMTRFDRVVHIWRGDRAGWGVCRHVLKEVDGPDSLMLRWLEEGPIESMSPPLADVLEFASRPGRLLVHCAAGVTRSTAVAVACKIARECPPEKAEADVRAAMIRDRGGHLAWVQAVVDRFKAEVKPIGPAHPPSRTDLVRAILPRLQPERFGPSGPSSCARWCRPDPGRPSTRRSGMRECLPLARSGAADLDAG